MKTKMSFDLDRDGRKGTKEWSDKSYNICIGCEHGCPYCYAKSRRCRFEAPTRTPGNWEKQTINPRIEKFGAEVQPIGTVMFPTSHDITPQFLFESLTTIKNLVRKNDVLIVTKPHLSVIEILCKELAEHRNRILFRFTIGSLNPDLCKFWEPGAPGPTERVVALQHAYKKGFRTSISIEPMLDSVEATCELVTVLAPHVTDSIWIGKMQRVPQKLNAHVAGFAAARQKIAEQQADDEILKLVARLGPHRKIRWKDSIKAVLARYEQCLSSVN